MVAVSQLATTWAMKADRPCCALGNSVRTMPSAAAATRVLAAGSDSSMAPRLPSASSR